MSRSGLQRALKRSRTSFATGLHPVSQVVQIPKIPHYTLESAKLIIPHRNKRSTGGEDSAFCGPKYLGVADGVGGWSEVGVNSGEYSRELLLKIQSELEALDEKDFPMPVEILKAAYAKTRSVGSSTCCLVFLNDKVCRINTANVGDSGFILYRPSSKEVLHKSSPQWHSFNFPKQLGTDSSDKPEHADVEKFDLKLGDWVVLATDGVWDNLYVDQIVGILDGAAAAQDAANAIANAAYSYSLDGKWKAPFCLQVPHYYPSMSSGGKEDDIAVVVGLVKEKIYEAKMSKL